MARIQAKKRTNPRQIRHLTGTHEVQKSNHSTLRGNQYSPVLPDLAGSADQDSGQPYSEHIARPHAFPLR